MFSRVFLLHSSLHGHKAFLIEELFHNLIILHTLSDAWHRLITFRLVLILVLLTTLLEVGMLGILEYLISTLIIGLTALLRWL